MLDLVTIVTAPSKAVVPSSEELALNAEYTGSEFIVLGEITGHFGVKGWLKIKSFTRPIEHILDFPEWFVGILNEAKKPLAPQRFEVIDGRKQGPGLVVKLASVDSREQAETILKKSILIRQSALEDLAAGEYYWSQLVGLQVINTDGIDFGHIDHLLETGANDVMVVSDRSGSDVVNGMGEGCNERLLPWSDEVVLRVDLKSGTMLVDWEADF